MKVETDIIANISTIPRGRAWIFVIMCVTAFRTDLIVFICDVIMCFTSDWPISLCMRVTNWPNIFVDQGQFSDPDFISGTHQRENVQFADKMYLLLYTDLYLNVLLETGKFIFKIDDERHDFILPLFSNIHVSIAYRVYVSYLISIPENNFCCFFCMWRMFSRLYCCCRCFFGRISHLT